MAGRRDDRYLLGKPDPAVPLGRVVRFRRSSLASQGPRCRCGLLAADRCPCLPSFTVETRIGLHEPYAIAHFSALRGDKGRAETATEHFAGCYENCLPALNLAAVCAFGARFSKLFKEYDSISNKS